MAKNKCNNCFSLINLFVPFFTKNKHFYNRLNYNRLKLQILLRSVVIHNFFSLTCNDLIQLVYMRISKSVTSFFYNLFLHESNSHLICRFEKFCKYSSFRLNKFDSVLIESLQENLSRAKKWTFFLIVITTVLLMF